MLRFKYRAPRHVHTRHDDFLSWSLSGRTPLRNECSNGGDDTEDHCEDADEDCSGLHESVPWGLLFKVAEDLIDLDHGRSKDH